VPDYSASSMGSLLVFIHGIGGPRDAERERAGWIAALVEGARRAGHSAVAATLSASVDIRFVDYSDLMASAGAQGFGGEILDDEADFLCGLVATLLDELAEDADDQPTRRAITEARAQLSGEGGQGVGAPVRMLGAALTATLQIPGLRRASQWASGLRLLGALAQVGRYLRRGELEDGCTLDERVRARVLAALPPDRSAVVVAHSLGSVVAFEALHAHSGPVSLLVTLGSPLTTAAVVLHRVRPTPLRTPLTVERWLNFWDRDDIVVARPKLDRRIAANAFGVLPVSNRVDSDGVWVHTATKYLAQPAVAGPIVEAYHG
jgi:pimeloyl-ACP methyl ester carboxylesterase